MLQYQARGTPDKSLWWRSHIAAWKKCGQSQRKYCAQYGLALSTFSLWRRRLASATPRLEIVPLHRAILNSVSPAVVVVAGGRYRVEVNEGIRADVLRTILEALEGPA